MYFGNSFFRMTLSLAKSAGTADDRLGGAAGIAATPHRHHLDAHTYAWRADHFARFHTMSIVTPGVSRFVNVILSVVLDVMIRRRLGAPTKFGNVLVSMFAWIVFVFRPP